MRNARSLRPVRCAVYARKSTEEGLQQEFNSLDAQREAGEAYIKSQAHEGWTLVEDQYDDGGFTGGNMERPALARLLADIHAGKIDCVVVYKVDRLSRSLLDFARMMETFEGHQVAFVSVTQQFNTSTSMGRLMLNVLLSFAQFEREVISERTRDKIAAARRKGKWSGGMPLLGYDVDPQTHKLVVNPAEAEQVRAIFELYLEKPGLLSAAEELNRRGWTSKRWTTRKGHARGGRPFNKASLYKLLTNVVYPGRIRYKSETHPGEHEAIVSPEVWQRVQIRLKNNVRGPETREAMRFGAVLKGLLRCASCGCSMSPTHAKKNGHKCYRYYVCVHAQQRGWKVCPTKSISAEPVERFVVEQLRALSADSDASARLRREDERRLEKVSRECESARRDLFRDEGAVGRLMKQLEANRQLGGKRLAALERELETARHTAGLARERLRHLETARVAQQEAVDSWRLFDPEWETIESAAQSLILGRLVNHLEYDGPASRLRIRLKPGPLATVAREAADQGLLKMSEELTIAYDIDFRPHASWRHKLRLFRQKDVCVSTGRVPRIARLMALAIRFEQLRCSGDVTDYAMLAKLGHVSRARITQVMNLLHLAPDIQQEILFLPCVQRGKDPIHLRQLQPIAGLMSWRRQRARWRALRCTACSP